MHITFFDLYSWEKREIRKQLKDHHLELFCESVSMEILEKVKNTEVISGFIYSTFGKKEIDMLPKLKMITTRSTGYDHIDVEYCKKKGIALCTVPFYGENTVAEHTFALMLSLSRNVHKSYIRSQQGNFSIDGLMGFDLKDKTLGVIGAGKIGQHVIRIAKGFGMEVLAYDPFQNELLSEVLDFKYADLDTILEKSDILTIHVPYNKATHHLIGCHNVQAIKKGALLINTARGAIVETSALLTGLESGIIAGAGLDVLEGEHMIMEEKELLHHERTKEQLEEFAMNYQLIHRDDVVFTPHIAFYSKEALERIINTTIENIQAFASGKSQNAVS